MYVILDNSSMESLALFCYGDGTWKEHRYPSASVGGILGALQALLAETNTPLSDLKGLGVVVGKGRFTATRLAVTVANTLSFAIGIPVVALADLKFDDLPAAFARRSPGALISATYSGEANIGKHHS